MPICFSAGSGGVETATAIMTKSSVKLLSGPSTAFKVVKGVKPTSADINPLTSDGIVCNGADGWKLSGCYIHAVGTNGDISAYPNGCVSHDVASASLTAICIR